VIQSPVCLSVGDIRRQIQAELMAIEIAQWGAYRKLPSLFRMVPSMTSSSPKLESQMQRTRRVLPHGEYDRRAMSY